MAVEILRRETGPPRPLLLCLATDKQQMRENNFSCTKKIICINRNKRAGGLPSNF